MMPESAWRELVLQAVMNSENGDSRALELVVQLLTGQDTARHALREIGFGGVGASWSEIVEAIRNREV